MSDVNMDTGVQESKDSVIDGVSVQESKDPIGDVQMTGPPEESIDEDDDPIVQEIDIFLNHLHDPPDFMGDLYLLQYPLRPVYRPYGDQGKLKKAELKQKAGHLKLTHQLNTANNYAEGQDPRTNLSEHVLTSTSVSNPGCGYAVGVIHEGKMVLTPIAAVNQMRPDFSHMNKPGFRTQHEGNDAVDDQMVDEVDQTKTVRVEYGERKTSVVSEIVETEENEPWVSLDLYEDHSMEAKDVYEKHFVSLTVAAAETDLKNDIALSEDPKLKPIEFTGTAREYLGRMCGQASASSGAKRKSTPIDDGPNQHTLSRLPLERQLEAILRHYGVVSYSQLKSKLPQSTLRQIQNSDEKIFEMLQKCGVLVQGNFVLKSDLAGFQSRAEICRDVMLKLWCSKDGVEPDKIKKVQEQFKLSHPVVMDIIMSVAHLDRRTNIYRLKKPKDTEFINAHPELVKNWAAWWERHIPVVIDKFKRMQQGNAEEKAGSSRSSHSKMVGTVRSALAHTAMTVAELRRFLQKQDPTTSVKEDDVLKILETEDELMNVKGIWMQCHSQKEQHDKFRMTAINMFRTVDSITKEELLEQYKSRHGGACELSDVVMRSLLKEFSDRQIAEDGSQAFVFKGVTNNLLR